MASAGRPVTTMELGLFRISSDGHVWRFIPRLRGARSGPVAVHGRPYASRPLHMRDAGRSPTSVSPDPVTTPAEGSLPLPIARSPAAGAIPTDPAIGRADGPTGQRANGPTEHRRGTDRTDGVVSSGRTIDRTGAPQFECRRPARARSPRPEPGTALTAVSIGTSAGARSRELIGGGANRGDADRSIVEIDRVLVPDRLGSFGTVAGGLNFHFWVSHRDRTDATRPGPCRATVLI